MTKEWFTAAELAGQKGMPAHATNVTRKAKSQNWEYRQITGLRGVNFEYHASSLPQETQEALGLEGVSKPVQAENNDSNMVTIQIYSAKAKTWNKAKPETHMVLPKGYLPKSLSEQELNNLFALEAPDSTMQPTLNAGELVLVSRVANKTAISTGVFVIETNIGITIKRLKPNLAGTEIKVCCDSDKFDDETLKREDFDKSIRLVGKVAGAVTTEIN
uniref:HTH Mu-type domain-containing protein n=1 Tax=Marinomonas sp. (strain MWYL1) TaxID=400668 RepID=A6W3I3_MARMS